jgi:hypothetical protein
MRIYKVIFYIDDVPIEGGELLLTAIDLEQAEQTLRLRLNSKRGIPSFWNSYSQPIEINL